MTPELLQFVELAPLGFFIGGFGTLVGAGGGSLLVPALLFLMPDRSAASITAMSLAVVFFNAYSGTVAYVRMGRIDFRFATLFTLASLPGSIVGVLLVHEVDRDLFEPVFGALLVFLGGFLVYSPLGKPPQDPVAGAELDNASSSMAGAISIAYIAFLTSLLGIGGGIIYVPFLIRVMRLPPHTATATSQFVLTFVSLTATITHVSLGEFDSGLAPTMFLAVGVMMGAPLGAALSARLHGSMIVRLLAVSLCVAGVRLLWRPIG